MKEGTTKRDRRQPPDERRKNADRRQENRDHGVERRRENRRGPIEYPGF